MKQKLLILLLVLPALIFAQSGGESFNWLEIVLWAGGGLVSVESISTGVLLLTQLIKKWFKTNGTITMIVSWVMGFAIAGVGKLLTTGMFVEQDWLFTGIVGLASGLAANGYFSIAEMREFLNRKLPKYKI